MENIELAKALFKANFLLAQTDCPNECYNITYLVAEVEKLPAADGIRLLMAVLEVKDIMLTCKGKLPTGLENMHEFPYLQGKLKWYDPRNL